MQKIHLKNELINWVKCGFFQQTVQTVPVTTIETERTVPVATTERAAPPVLVVKTTNPNRWTEVLAVLALIVTILAAALGYLNGADTGCK